MVQSACDSPVEVVRQLLRDPTSLGEGYRVIDHDVPLTPALSVDMVALDTQGRPVLVLVPAEPDLQAFLGRALLALGEARLRGALLDRLYRREMVSFDPGARVLLLVPRLDAGFRAAIEALGTDLIQVVQTHLIQVGENFHLVLCQHGGVPMAVGHSPVALAAVAAEEPPVGDAAGSTRSEGAGERNLTHRHVNGFHSEPPGNGNEDHHSPAPPASTTPRPPAGAPPPDARRLEPADAREGSLQLLDEAKRRILRISDDIEEEVDGEQVRFLVHNRVLAVLTAQPGPLGFFAGDRPGERVEITDLRDLGAALNQVFRRFLEVTGQTSTLSRA